MSNRLSRFTQPESDFSDPVRSGSLDLNGQDFDSLRRSEFWLGVLVSSGVTYEEQSSELQAEKRGNFVVVGCIEGPKVVSWSLNVSFLLPTW